MGRMMAFIVVVVCAAQVVLLRAQERSPGPPDIGNPRFAYHRANDGYVRLDLRSGEVSTCKQREADWTCTPAREERAALEEDIARLKRDNALLKNALLEHGLPLPAPSSEATAAARSTAPSAPESQAVASALPSEDRDAPPRPPAAIPTETDVPHERGKLDRAVDVMEHLWHRLVALVAAIGEEI